MFIPYGMINKPLLTAKNRDDVHKQCWVRLTLDLYKVQKQTKLIHVLEVSTEGTPRGCRVWKGHEGSWGQVMSCVLIWVLVTWRCAEWQFIRLHALKDLDTLAGMCVIFPQKVYFKNKKERERDEQLTHGIET